jgi:hypothetical protein
MSFDHFAFTVNGRVMPEQGFGAVFSGINRPTAPSTFTTRKPVAPKRKATQQVVCRKKKKCKKPQKATTKNIFY